MTHTKKRRYRNSSTFLFHAMLFFPVALLFLYNVLPIPAGILMAFQNFQPGKGFFGSEFVGFKNFIRLWRLPDTLPALRNTVVIAVWKIAGNLMVPIVFALLLNEIRVKWFKRTVQTITYLPYFLSWAVIGGILRSLFQYDGMVNGVLTSLGMERIMFLGSNSWFPVIAIVSDVWKDMGYNMIIFLAAITNVDPALHESAALDGANRWQQAWHITLPTIRPIVVMLLVLSLGSVLSAGMEQILLLYNPMVYESADIIDTLVYRLGLVNHQWSLSAAVGMMKSAISFVLVAVSYRIAVKYFDYQVF